MTDNNTFSIAVSGKGGVGKTNMSAMLVRQLCKKGSLLAIDADPDSNLSQALGVQVEKSIGDCRENFAISAIGNPKTKEEVNKFGDDLPDIIKTTDNFDLIVMGRPEGEGCYCGINHIIRKVLDTKAKEYDFIVVDCEAGLEHLSRRTTRDISLMIIVTDPSTYGIIAARSIIDISNELLINFGNIMLVADKITEETKGNLDKLASENGLNIDAYIPYDEGIINLDVTGDSIFELPHNSKALKAVEKLCNEILS